MEPRVRVQIADEAGERLFGAGPWNLLSLLEERGSLSAAARVLGMSYSKAVRIVNRAEQELAVPLTVRKVGGEGGGASELTPQGRDLLRRYAAWRDVSERLAGECFSQCFAGIVGLPKLGCVVMAAGRAARFGAQKLLAPLGEKPVLLRTLEAVPQDRFDLAVVAPDGPVADAVRAWVLEKPEERSVTLVAPEGPHQADSLRSGLQALRDRAGCLFLVGDQPLVTPQSLGALADGLAEAPGSVVRLAWQGRAGNPVLFPSQLFSALETLRGDVGGQALLSQRPEIPQLLVEAQSPLELRDCDTPAQLEELRASLSPAP